MSKRRPSPAMIIAMIALCLGLGGSAIAASNLSRAQVKKIAKKQANKRINARESSLRVAHAAQATNADRATNASSLEVSGDGKNLVAGFATVGDGANPPIVNAGGKRITNVSVAHAALTDGYEWTFTGSFAGVTAEKIGLLTSTFDSDAFTNCWGNNDGPGFPAVTDTTIVVRTFCHSDGSITFSSDPHTVELFIAP